MIRKYEYATKYVFRERGVTDVIWKNLMFLSPSWISWDLALWSQKSSSVASKSTIFLEISLGFCIRIGSGGPCWIKASSSLCCLNVACQIPKMFPVAFLYFRLKRIGFIHETNSSALGPLLCEKILIFWFSNPHCFESESHLSSSRVVVASLEWATVTPHRR